MKKPSNYDEVDPSSTFNRLVAGGYVIRIMNVEDNTEKQYLTISYDVAEGDFKDYFDNQFAKWGNWNGNFIVSYTEAAAANLKRFIENVEASNKNFAWDWDNPKKCEKRGLGIVLQEEEYLNTQGEKKVKFSNFVDTYTCNEIREGKFKLKPLKTLNNSSQTKEPSKSQTFDISEDDIQF